jgi:deoxyguanosine kinase
VSTPARIVAIEGLPGSGKTTCAQRVADQLGWPLALERFESHPFLGTIYQAQLRHNMVVEVQFLLLHFAEYRGLAGTGDAISDYAPAKDLLFADLVLNAPESEAFSTLYHQLYAGLPRPSLAIFLDTPTDECLRRVKARGREFERHMTEEWLRELDRVYRRRMADLADRVFVLKTGADAPSDVATRAIDAIAADIGAIT